MAQRLWVVNAKSRSKGGSSWPGAQPRLLGAQSFNQCQQLLCAQLLEHELSASVEKCQKFWTSIHRCWNPKGLQALTCAHNVGNTHDMHTGQPTGVALSHCITWFQTELILTTCQIICGIIIAPDSSEL